MPKVTSVAVYYDRRRTSYKERDPLETRALFPRDSKERKVVEGSGQTGEWKRNNAFIDYSTIPGGE